jgi:hypothetical protein
MKSEFVYKCKGSVVMWVLRYKLCDAFIIWMLAQKFDRETHRKATGYIEKNSFLKSVGINTNLKKRTQKRWLSRAVEYGFLDNCNDCNFLVRSHRKLVNIALNHISRECENDEFSIPPEVYIKSDREFTRKIDGWVDPNSLLKTKALLYGIVAIQGNNLSRGRENHSRLISMNRRTVQRLSKLADLIEVNRYMLININKLLVRPLCSPRDAIDFVVEIVKKLSKSSRHPFLRRHLNKKPFLAIQLPKHYFSRHDLKEVPATREAIGWVYSGTGCGGRCSVTIARQELPGWNANRFFSSKDLLGGLENLINLHAKRVDEILAADECRLQILNNTGAEDIKPVLFAKPFIWCPAFDAAPYRWKQKSELVRVSSL